MTDYELVDSFMSHINLVMTFFLAFITVTSAFLVAVHLAGSGLSSRLITILSSLYSITSIFLIYGTFSVFRIVASIYAQIREQVSWHPVASEASWMVLVTSWGMTLVMVLLFVSSLLYLKYVRGVSSDL